MREIKIGLFGVGYFGNFHLINLLKTPFKLIGFHDPDKQRSELISKKYNIESFQDANELIYKSDAIDITTPTSYHYTFIKKAIESDKHVFVEKPLANNFIEAMEIKKIHENSNIVIQVGHIERFNPVIDNLVIDGSQIVNLESNRFSTYNPRGTDVSVVFDLMIHDIDIVVKLMGNKIKGIEATGFSKFGPFVEFASATLTFDNNSKATLNASIIHPNIERKIKIWTKEKYFELDLGKKHTEIYSFLPEPDKNMNIISEKDRKEYITNNSILDELNDFYDCITSNKKPRVSIDDGLNAIKLAEQISEKINIR
jgi:predicted dehydrogenase